MKHIILTSLLIISSHVMAAYKLYIEKKDRISLKSWLEIYESDSTLTHEKTVSITNPNTGEVLSMEAEGMCVLGTEDFQTTFD